MTDEEFEDAVDEHRTGVFVCAGCELPLFKSETKFESRTGWPSFWSQIEGSVGTKPTGVCGWNAPRCIAGAAVGRTKPLTPSSGML
jgi:peptide methionine sulfoxide reductase MsrB